MIAIESLHEAKKRVKKFYRDYFTIYGEYTSLLPDKVYLKKLYKKKLGYELNLKNPRTFNEKLNWLKLFDRRPEYTMMADKFAVREYVSEKIGQEYLIPLLGVWDSVGEIDFEQLPDEFVLKCNHDNGVIICKDKDRLDIEETKAELQAHLDRDYYKKRREWPYKDIKRRIICEKYMSEKGSASLTDYKFFCFNGKVEALFIATGRPYDTRFDFYDREFGHLDIINDHPNADKEICKPEKFEEMVTIAERMSRDIPHVRVDLYCINGQIYFSEMTFSHFAGFKEFEPDEWNKKFGDLICLPKKKRRHC